MRRTSVFITLLGFRFCQSLKYLFNNYYVEADILKLLCDMYRGCTLGFYTVHSVHKPYCIPRLQYYTHSYKSFKVIGAQSCLSLSCISRLDIETGLLAKQSYLRNDEITNMLENRGEDLIQASTYPCQTKPS